MLPVFVPMVLPMPPTVPVLLQCASCTYTLVCQNHRMIPTPTPKSGPPLFNPTKALALIA
jgi:hypothetical protein